MALSHDKLKQLVRLVASSQGDPLDCDSCYERIAEFAEAHLANRNLCEAMQCVKLHLENCPCCQDEFQALLAALQEMDFEGECG